MTGMRSNTAAIYLRKSTEDDGKSVAQQERDIRARAGQLGIDVIAVYREDDGTSASSVTKDQGLTHYADDATLCSSRSTRSRRSRSSEMR